MVIKNFLADDLTIRVLAKIGEIYAVYINRIIGKEQILPGRFSGTATIQIEFPAGSYSLELMDVETGNIVKTETIIHPGGIVQMISPFSLFTVIIGIFQTKD